MGCDFAAPSLVLLLLALLAALGLFLLAPAALDGLPGLEAVPGRLDARGSPASAHMATPQRSARGAAASTKSEALNFIGCALAVSVAHSERCARSAPAFVVITHATSAAQQQAAVPTNQRGWDTSVK